MLSESEKQILLHIARQSIEAAVSERNIPKTEIIPPALLQPAGAFVSLHEYNELRGCIGYVDPVKPLYEIVMDAAMKAALDDPRFTPVQPEELPHIAIEISVLSALKVIKSSDEIEIGIHGLVVDLAHYRGLLLPQVAVSTGWDKETFLHQTFRKSGLPEHLWQHPEVKVFSFTAEVFSETPVPQS